MKTLILVLLFAVITISVNAQMKSQFTQEQLKIDLKKAKIMKGAGEALIISGVALIVASYIYNATGGEEHNKPDDPRGFGLLVGGAVVAYSGAPFLAIGWTKKWHIEVALSKFKGTASAYGIGLKIRF